MTKVLMVLTNTTRYHGTTDATGLWLGEATEFAEEMQHAGVTVDYVSPRGGFVPLDPRGMKYADAAIMNFYERPDFQQRALTHSLSPDDIQPDDYAAIYFTGGHGVMWDFPDDPALHQIALRIYQDGGILSSVCHGIAGLLNLKNDARHYLIAGKRITGFTTAEEVLAGKVRVVPFLNQVVARQHGAHFEKKRAYAEFAVRDGQFITGQNPFSVRAVARLVLAALPREN